MAQMQGDHDIASGQNKETIKEDLITKCEEETSRKTSQLQSKIVGVNIRNGKLLERFIRTGPTVQLTKSQQTFYIEAYVVSNLGFVVHTVSFQLFNLVIIAFNEWHDHVPIKLYLGKHMVCQIQPAGLFFLTLVQSLKVGRSTEWGEVQSLSKTNQTGQQGLRF